mgnify:CR=1 FL=1
MLKIKTNKGYLDLGGDFTVQIDEKSPIMNDRGTQTVPVTVPYTSNNAKLTGFAHRLDLCNKPLAEDSTCTVQDGVYRRTGKINIVSAGRMEGTTLNIGFDNSEAYNAWKAKKLNSIELPVKEYSSVISLCTHLQQVLNGYKTDYAVFQIMTANESKDGVYYPKYLNYIYPTTEGSSIYKLRYEARTETFLIDGTPTETTLPTGYGVTAFLYVWRALELIFSEFGYSIIENPFKTDKELSRIVILNNAADCCVKGMLSYADLMPDCTVEQFLNALNVRFGMVYNVSSDTKAARIRLIKDIIKSSPGIDFSNMVTSHPVTTYETARQIKLSAKTSFTSAAPSVERFEDYLKGHKNVAKLNRVDTSKRVNYLNYEKTTGKWYKWDSENNRIVYSSSSFFNWDRKTNNVEDDELSSDDECVPMDFATNNILTPQYLASYVHRYTYLKNNGSSGSGEDSESEETPLSFAFSFVGSANCNYPFGSSLSVGPSGDNVRFYDGTEHKISLLFQFDNGLFSNFWKEYDAVLRHSFNQVETNVLLPIHTITQIDLLNTVSLCGQILLPDSFSYSLPANKIVSVNLILRTLRLIEPYDLDKEHDIPAFGDSLFIWEFRNSNISQKQEAERIRIENEARKEYNTSTSGVTGSRINISFDGYTTRNNDKYIVENYPDAADIELTRTYRCKAITVVTVQYLVAGTVYDREITYETEIDYQDVFVSVIYSE